MIHLQDLSVGQISGMIAAAIFVLQFLIPLALPLAMLGLLRLKNSDISTNAISWSLITRFLHSSLWPTILQTNSSAFSTQKSVLSVSWLRPLIVALVGVAAIVTPLGLYEAVAPIQVPSQKSFHYIKDTSPIGLGTPPRTNATWSRLCGGFGYMNCPNSGNDITRTRNSTGVDITTDGFSSKIPAKVVSGFESGLSAFSSSVSSAFDLQYRSITTRREKSTDLQPGIDNGTDYNVGAFRPLSTLLLSDDIQVYEGLIVDMKQGGIGLRNHTAPPWTQYGSTWSEDILFIEPESVCVDTNLTMEFEIPFDGIGSSDLANLRLKDRGGFVNLNQLYPPFDRYSSQENPDLWLRAYKAAYVNNILSMAWMNITNLGNQTIGKKAFDYVNSELDKEFPLHWRDGEIATDFTGIQASSLQVSTSFGQYLKGTDEGKKNYTGNYNDTSDLSYTISEPPLYPNPYHLEMRSSSINSSNDSLPSFATARLLCQGAGGGDYANITNMVASCGLLYGAPRRRDGSSSLLFDPGSSWTLPMFSCISAVKASIKTVTFRFNGTDTLSGLSVTDITPKVYADDASKPLWGVENTEDYLSDLSPLWGIVTPEAAKSLNLSTLRKEELYVPGWAQDDILSTNTAQNLPAVDFPAMALANAYAIGNSETSRIDYSGSANLAMYRLWQDLSREARSAGKILNLVWTDVAANLVLGTKSLGTESKRVKRNDVDGEGQLPLVTVYEHRVRYHYAYGIPAFLALALASLILVSSCLLAVLGPANPFYLRMVLEQTSAGRLLTGGKENQGKVFTLGTHGWEKNGMVDGGHEKGSMEYQPVNRADDEI